MVIGGSKGPAIYLDLVSPNPLWTLRHADALVRVLSKPLYSGGRAIRLQNALHATVWVAGSVGNSGFVGSANNKIDRASPVAHLGTPITVPRTAARRVRCVPGRRLPVERDDRVGACLPEQLRPE